MSRILFEFFDGEQTLVVVGIPSAEAFGTPTIDAGQELLVSGIPSAEAFGAPVIVQVPQPSIGSGYSNWSGGWTSRRRIFREEKCDENPWAKCPPVLVSENDRENTKDEARRALRKVAAWMHPDAVARMHPESRAQLEERFGDITELYEALNRREESTRNRRLVTSTVDPEWDAFLRSLKQKDGAIVLASDQVARELTTKKKSRKKKLRKGFIRREDELAYMVVRSPISTTAWVLIAAAILFSFWAGWTLSRPKTKKRKARRSKSSEPSAVRVSSVQGERGDSGPSPDAGEPAVSAHRVRKALRDSPQIASHHLPPARVARSASPSVSRPNQRRGVGEQGSGSTPRM